MLIRRRGQEPIVLTGSGLSLWLALERPSSIDDLARRLAADHGTDPETVRSDIEPVIDDLVGRGVLRGG